MSTKKGRVGTPMTTFRLPRRPAPSQETGTRMCPTCWQLTGQPCRTVLSSPGAKRIKLGRVLPKLHEERRGESMGDPGKLPPLRRRR